MSKGTGIIWKERLHIGSVIPTSVEDESRWGNDGTLSKSNGVLASYIRLPSGLWVKELDGIGAYVDIGDIGHSMKAVLAWIYPDDNTSRAIADFDGGTHSIELDGSGDLTATGWAAPTTYVNGVAAAAVAQDAWSLVSVITATSFLVSDFDIGREASYFDGKIGPLVLLSYAPSLGKIAAIFQAAGHWFGVE